MKNLLLPLMGLFTLVACSEDAYQEVDNRTETGTVENNSGGTMMPMTVSSGYNSPFQRYGSPKYGVMTTFTNNTPLLLELTPYGQDVAAQTFLWANGSSHPNPTFHPDFIPFEGQSFFIMPGATETNYDTEAPVAASVAPYGNSLGSIIYDFGSWSPNFRMYHYGKIYYFKYKVTDNFGNIIKEGYIKHKFYDDMFDSGTINGLDSEWELAGSIPPHVLPMHDVVVMFHKTEDEMCLTNRDNYSTNGFAPLLSSVDVVDPATGITHVLEFDCGIAGAAGVTVSFN